MKKRWAGRRLAGYAAVAATCFVLAMLAGWMPQAGEIDNYAYDWMFRWAPVQRSASHSVVVAIDDAALNANGGIRKLRTILTRAIQEASAAKPKAIAVDLILADPGDEGEDSRLEAACKSAPHLVLATDLVRNGWEDPISRLARSAALGHVHSDEVSTDGVTREISLEKTGFGQRRWALALEAARAATGGMITESPSDVQIGSILVPAARREAGRPLRIRYAPPGSRNVIPLGDLKNGAALAELRDKVVFIGVTSLSAARDRAKTPYGGDDISGVEVHAEAFETLLDGHFLVDASNLPVVGFCLLITVTAGLIFSAVPGWTAYALAAMLLAAAHAFPFFLFRNGIVFPYFGPVASAWLAFAGAASYQHFGVRRQLRKSEADRARYQQAIHFVTHEMRTPLTAIQGSSELIGRYNLNDDKRRQIAEMINSESKRLAGMIRTFLDIERLSEGQVELKQELFPSADAVQACAARARPLAERKEIHIELGSLEGTIRGDRELMEYAVYNLLTNAIKYSPPGTAITVWSRAEGGFLRLSVQDQGMGMDAKELRHIFRKFYRTRGAETSGEAGTGIGLSLVDQIVSGHGGRLEVTSKPGSGSCFSIVLPARAPALL